MVTYEEIKNPMTMNSKQKCIHHLFEAQARQAPEATALVFGNQQLSYNELNQRANQLAHHLNRLDVKPETLVAICAERSLEAIIGFLGILKAGGAYVPLDPNYPAERLNFILEDTQASVVLTKEATINNRGQAVVDLDDWAVMQQYPTTNLAVSVTPGTLAYVMYTSGSTGLPKGVLVEHQNVLALLYGFEQIAPHADMHSGTFMVPISFDVSVWEIFSQLCYGGTLHILCKEMLQNMPQLVEYLLKNRITSTYLPPALLEPAVTELLKHRNPLLCRMLVGVEPILQNTLQTFQKLSPEMRIINGYGPTETTICATFFVFGEVENPERYTPIGKPVANYQVYVLDAKNAQLPIGTPGELCIAGAGLTRGYLNRPELTAELFTSNPFGYGRLYHTGDQGRYLPDGNIEFLGRIDNQIKIRGFRVELGEIEFVLNQHPEVRQSVVVSHSHNNNHQRLIAYVVPRITQDSREHDIVQQWQRIMDEAYCQTATHDSTLHIGGWVDSYHDSKPMAATEVQEWVEHTVDRILALKPRRVLEIGCGTGMLLFRIAPACESYLGTDLSSEGIAYLKPQVQQAEQLSNTAVDLITCPADEVRHCVENLKSNAATPPFDTIIINSVIQYFPSIHYLVQVLEDLLPLLTADAHIFIGDVVSYPLMEAFHTSVQIYQAADTLTTAELRQNIALHLIHEQRLMIAPNFFTALQQHCPTIGHVDIQLKPGRAMNEMTRFRYDVTLHSKKPALAPPKTLEYLNWQHNKSGLTLDSVCKHLAKNEPASLLISHIPNPRTRADVQAVTLLSQADTPATVGELRTCIQLPATVEPEQWRALQNKIPYQVSVHWTDDGATGEYDVLLQHRDQLEICTDTISYDADNQHDWQIFANHREQTPPEEWLGTTLRSFLKQKLPDYMLPTVFEFLEAFPLTPNGKIDRKALPEPSHARTISMDNYIAPRSKTERQLIEIWEDILHVSPIGIEDTFFDLGGHSLMLTQLLARLRDDFSTKLSLGTLFSHPTVAKLAIAIEEITHTQQDSSSLMSMSVEELQAKVVLDSTIRPPQGENPSVKPLKNSTGILLTGATGFLGAFVLEELLQRTSTNIYCLVRSQTIEEGWQRIADNLKRYGLEHITQNNNFQNRIVSVPGNLEQALLGLELPQFEQLAKVLDHIYHVAAAVNILYPYQAMEAANVQGTQEILRIAAHTTCKAVHYVSSVGIFEASAYVKREILYENEDLTTAENIYGGYSQSKWVSEQLIHIAHQRGIPAAIYRPGGITAHSQTYIANTDDFLARLIKLFVQQGQAPDLSAPIDTTPVDYVSQALVRLSDQPESSGQIFHLTNPKPARWTEILDSIEGHQIQRISYKEWLETLQILASSGEENALGALLPLLIEKLPGTEYTYFDISSMTKAFDCQNTLRGLSGTELACPPADLDLLSTTLKRYL
jgi:amino acid adenylation domain-containing protein/thioester reductase-like protein